MVSCPSCGTENQDGSKFCNGCGSPLDASPDRRVVEERKVITALFCDLIGFTATSESADPEDVDTMLSAYAEMARTQIESHGGGVE
jgi:class 3 adenylate cyclase